MKQYAVEIIRQKWRLLSIILFLFLLNISLGIVVAVYQLPSLADMQIKRNDLRRQSTQAGQVNAVTLYRQGGIDLENLMVRIPEKKEFARVLSDLLEAAAGSAVQVGAISYKPEQLKDEPLLSYQLSLSVSGQYAAVKSFLSDLQEMEQLMIVDSVAFSNSDLLIENVTMNLHITVYLRGRA